MSIVNAVNKSFCWIPVIVLLCRWCSAMWLVLSCFFEARLSVISLKFKLKSFLKKTLDLMDELQLQIPGIFYVLYIHMFYQKNKWKPVHSEQYILLVCKSDLLKCLESLIEPNCETESPHTLAVMIDGAAIVNML